MKMVAGNARLRAVKVRKRCEQRRLKRETVRGISSGDIRNGASRQQNAGEVKRLNPYRRARPYLASFRRSGGVPQTIAAATRRQEK